MPEPKVTAICCSYNYARWLPRALDSALAQGADQETLEVVVVDDGSTDDTAEVVRPYLDSPLIRYVWKPNGGFASAVSRGIDEARGRYITFLDADDEWPANRLGAQLDVLDERDEIGLVYSDMAVINDRSQITHPSFMQMTGLRHPSGRLLAELIQGNFISGGSMMVRRSLSHLFNPIPSQIRCQDWWIATRVAAVSEIEWVPGVVYRYRRHGSNMNLGQGDRTGNVRDDFEFRRLILAGDEVDAVPLEQLLISASQITSTPLEFRRLVSISEDDRDRSRMLEAQARERAAHGQFDAALRILCRAQAADPSAERTALFQQMITLLNAQQLGLGEDVETRSVRVLAFASELVGDPRLLVEAAASLAGEDATVVCQVEDGRQLDALAALVETHPSALDMVAVTQPATVLAGACDVLLTAVPPAAPFDLMRTASSAAELTAALRAARSDQS